MSNEDWRERAERIEKTIAFIVEQQAHADARAEARAAEAAEGWKQAEERWKQADERAAKMDERWARTEEGIRSLLAVAEIHEREILELRESGKATDERLNVLINLVEKQMSERRNGEKPE